MELLAIFASSFVVGFTGALAPGPLLALDIREAMRLGAKAGPLVSLGHALADLGMVVVLALGVNQVVEREVAIAVVGPLGGAFLVWLGWRMVRAAPARAPWSERALARGPRAPLYPVVAGALVSLANPYFVVWWLTAGTSFLVAALPLGHAGAAFFYTGHILSDFAWFSLVAMAVGSGRRFMGDGAYRVALVISGLILAIAGGAFLTFGIREAVSL